MMEFLQDILLLFFPVKLSPPVIISNSETISQLLLSTKKKHSSHTKISELAVFIHILKIVLGLQKICSFGILHSSDN